MYNQWQCSRHASHGLACLFQGNMQIYEATPSSSMMCHNVSSQHALKTVQLYCWQKMYRGVIQFLFLCSTYELPCMNKEGTLYTCCECFKINLQQTLAAVGIAFCTQTGQGERLSGMIARAVSSGY